MFEGTNFVLGSYRKSQFVCGIGFYMAQAISDAECGVVDRSEPLRCHQEAWLWQHVGLKCPSWVGIPQCKGIAGSAWPGLPFEAMAWDFNLATKSQINVVGALSIFYPSGKHVILTGPRKKERKKERKK